MLANKNNVVLDSGIERDSIDSIKGSEDSVSSIEKSPPEIVENGSEESCKAFGFCQEKVISSSEANGELSLK